MLINRIICGAKESNIIDELISLFATKYEYTIFECAFKIITEITRKNVSFSNAPNAQIGIDNNDNNNTTE